MKTDTCVPNRVIVPLFFFLLLLVTPALGIEWVVFSTTQEGNELSYDQHSVRKVEEDTVRLWERIVFTDNNVQDNVKTTLFVREIHCLEKRYRIISLLDYSIQGEKLFSGTDERATWFPIPPDTHLELLRETVCR
jgi:hypothetical protein